MTKVKRWNVSSTALDVLSQEIEAFLNGEEGEVRILQSFVFQGWLILIAIFGDAK
jgi:hypothetical protein